MTTKAELQGLCIDATEAFLRTHAIEQALRERELVDQRVVTGIEVGADVSFRTRCGVEVDSETGGLTVESRSNSADFAVWFTMGRTYGEIAGDATGPDRPDSKVPPVKIPLLVTAMVGEKYTQYHPISTGEMEFDEDGSPYVYRTNLPFLRHRLPTPLERQGQLFISGSPVKLVPARSDADRLSSDDDIADETVRETVQIHLDESLRRISGRELDEHEPL